MNKKNNIMSKDNQSRSHYNNVFTDFQSLGEYIKNKDGKKSYTQMQNEYSEYQNFLYKRALFGLKMYSEEEIKNMHWQKRKRIKKVHKRTQEELNKWKQARIIEITNKIFSLFHNSKIAKDFIDTYSEPDPTYICRTPLRDLGIRKEDVIDRLLDKGILPHNFRTLKEKG